MFTKKNRLPVNPSIVIILLSCRRRKGNKCLKQELFFSCSINRDENLAYSEAMMVGDCWVLHKRSSTNDTLVLMSAKKLARRWGRAALAERD